MSQSGHRRGRAAQARGRGGTSPHPLGRDLPDLQKARACWLNNQFDEALRLRKMLPIPWQEVRYEEAVHDPGAQARQALAFLGLAWDEAVLAYRDHLQRRPTSSPIYEAFARPVYTSSIGRWKNYASLMEPARERLQPFVREFGYD